ncbi:DUF4198 domain-containing protein [Virgibacillus sp. NKC19-16]|uniref:DUF4198 domain-containing protein n=1 Tax=Virgibacillus salidurans TaxID=2831673 RepID=UPI001F45F5A3|nr:DUF4198 domain-containing protein [Virgibacillus sp. NKC19-16]UJL45251.1 DUF4198 domain-containing protein [Virgibacillus sp. NKC19-16]
MTIRKTIVMAAVIIACMSIFSLNVSAHELYIEVEEFTESEELRVDVLWGHIRDYVDEANIEDFQLHVRYPNGDTDQLELEEVGVHSRAYVPITDEGAYTFWAERTPSTYTPDDGIAQLSNQFAKQIYHVGGASSNSEEAIEAQLEIIPNEDTAHFSTGDFSGTIRLDGSEIADATVTAYGPEHEVLEGVTDDDGTFNFTFDSTGKWLIKANAEVDEAGDIDGEEYEITSHTTTLLVNTGEADAEDAEEGSNMWSFIAMLVVGLLVGASVILIFLRKK